MAPVGREIVVLVFESLFLLVCCLMCYGTELWTKTPWKNLSRKHLRSLVQRYPSVIRNKSSSAWKYCSLLATRIKYATQLQSTREELGLASGQQGDLQEKGRDIATKTAELSPAAKRNARIWRTLCFFPPIFWLMAIAPACADLARQPYDIGAILLNQTNTTDSAKLEVDADIAGIGIRVGLYITVFLIILSLSIGFLHLEESGAKELGAAQLLNLLYLNLNAVKAAATKPRFKELKFPEIVIACICIDFTAAGLQMTTSDKGTLSARSFVRLSAVNQLFALVMMILMLSSIKPNIKDETHTYVVWWGRLDTQKGPSETTWIYIAVRSMMLFHGIWLDFNHTVDFDKLKKDWDALAPGDQELEKENESSDYEWAHLRATVFSKWMELLPTIFVGIVSIETLSKQLKSAPISSWGQSATLVLAMAGGLHWLYVIYDPIVSLLARLLSHFVDNNAGSRPERRHKDPTNRPRYDSSWHPGKRDWNSMLLSGAKDGRLKDVRRAFMNEAKVDHTDEEGKTALIYAIFWSRLDRGYMFDTVMGQKPNPNASAEPALLVAVRDGTPETVERLLQDGRSASWQKDQSGCKALELAVISGNGRCLESLLKAWINAKPHLTGTIWHFEDDQDAAGRSPLTAALQEGHWDCVRALCDYLIDHKEYDRIIRVLLSWSPPFTREQSDYLIKQSLKPGTSIVKGTTKTFLHLAVLSEKESSFDVSALAHTIKSCGYSVDSTDEEDRTPLLLAVKLRIPLVMKGLLRNGADPTLKDCQGVNAVQLLAGSHDWQLLSGFVSGAEMTPYLLPFLDQLSTEDLKWLIKTKLISFDMACMGGYLLKAAVSQGCRPLVALLTSKRTPGTYWAAYGHDWRTLAEEILMKVESWDEFYGKSDGKAYDKLVKALSDPDPKKGDPALLDKIRAKLAARLGPDCHDNGKSLGSNEK